MAADAAAAGATRGDMPAEPFGPGGSSPSCCAGWPTSSWT